MTVWSEDDCVARPRVGAGARIAQSTPKFKSRFHEAIEESGRRTENVVFPDGSREERPYLDCRLPPFSRRRRRSEGRVLAGETMQIARFPFLFSSVSASSSFPVTIAAAVSRGESSCRALIRSARAASVEFFLFFFFIYNSDRRKRA